ncbi:MAG: bifunctional folylpolyglutamate synthase/dihydrofolate synthase [Candidatus Methanogranum gryphiswaldense]|nr:MAG: bifunctional folylpolyglutamate synthase/dihydrofolate synthase [Candidatus Methanogranum sp. U3.2.1]
MDVKGVLEWLYGLQVHGIKLGLTNITELLGRLGNPQREFHSVHVAGTDGKGSTCACIDSILRVSGYRTGLYTSPHLTDFNERIKVSGQMITDEELSDLASEIMPIVRDMDDQGMRCTFFEVTTALAFLHFKRKGVEYAVIEVGMGGRFDATNVIIPDVCVICNISLEHTEFLGDTVEKIAFEKAGIIKPGIPCVTLNPEPALGVISRVADERLVELMKIRSEDIIVEENGQYVLRFRYKDESYIVSIPGKHQARNAALAIEAVARLRTFDTHIKSNVKKGLSMVEWPCRMQRLKKLPMVVDVTHTRAGSEDLVSDISELYGKVLLVFGVLGDKDIEHISQNLACIADKVIVTVPDSVRAAPMDRVLPIMTEYFSNVEHADNVGEAIQMALIERKEEEMILVTGSFYMAGEALTWLRKTYASF